MIAANVYDQNLHLYCSQVESESDKRIYSMPLLKCMSENARYNPNKSQVKKESSKGSRHGKGCQQPPTCPSESHGGSLDVWREKSIQVVQAIKTVTYVPASDELTLLPSALSSAASYLLLGTFQSCEAKCCCWLSPAEHLIQGIAIDHYILCV